MAKRNSLNTVKRTTSTKKSELTKKVNAATKKKTTTTKKTATKKTPPKKTTTVKKTTRTRVSKVNDDALKTMINIPVVDEKEINRSKKKTVLKEYDIKKKKPVKPTKANNIFKNIIITVIASLKLAGKYIIRFIIIVLSFIWKILKICGKAIYNFFKEDEKDKKKKKKYDTINSYDSDGNLELLKYKEYKGLEKVPVFFANRKMVMKDDMKKFSKKFKYGTLKDKILIIIMIGLIAIFSLGIIFCAYVVITAPEISEARLYKNNATVLLDVNGNEFKRLGTENREKVSYDQLPEVLVDAIVATEDSRFFQHNGIDIARFTKAVFGQLLGHSDAGGGSTLTMQVSKNAATSAEASGIKGLVRKFTDIYLSVFVFEKKYTKEQIMEFYVNLPNLGSGAYGVQQASQIYFGKDVSELSLTEAAMIAGMFQAPSAYNPYVYPDKAEARRNTVLALMYKHNYITKEEKEAAQAVPIKSLLYGRDTSLSPYIGFVDTVVEECIERTGLDPYTNSMVIHTTMDPAKQDVVNDVMNGVSYTWKNEYAQSGVAVINVKDGSITAIGAGRNKTAERSFNFATQTNRHPGSTAKPVIDYGPAIEYLGWGTGQTVIDDKYNYSGGGSIKNWDNKFEGIMTIKQALAKSRNIPALYTFQQTTNEQKKTFSNNLGWKPEESSGTLLESDSIGGFNGVSPLQSAAAYATFARGGTYIEPYSFTKIEFSDTGETYEVKPKKISVMSEETAYLITMILKYAVSSGSVSTGSVAGTDIAGKTGTSTVDGSVKKALGIKGSIIGDSWVSAYSPDYAISAWYGYPQLSKDYYLTQNEGGNARRGIIKPLVRGIIPKNSTFKRPSGVVSAEIELETDPLELASAYTPGDLRSTEYFKKGTVPSSTSSRFARLDNASDLKATTSGNTVNLTWKAAKTPDAINNEWLANYFSSSNLYSKWDDKYLNRRKEYNANTFGSFGYRVYLINAQGQTLDLGYTTNTHFSYTTDLSSAVTFVVKTSYEKFTANMSPGINVKAGAGVVTPTTTTKGKLRVDYLPTTTNFDSIRNAINNNTIFKVTYNGQQVNNFTKVIRFVNNGNSTTSMSDLTCGTSYDIYYEITYNGVKASGTRSNALRTNECG